MSQINTYAQVNTMSASQEIEIVINGAAVSATLNDSPAARDFLNLLPLTLTLEDYAGTEKISALPKRLSVADAPEGSRASAGDIAFFKPWGNLAIFYEDFRYAEGLIILGSIDGDLNRFKGGEEREATFRIAE